MTLTFLRAGRIFASALLCLAPACRALAAAPSFTLIQSASRTLTPGALRAAEKAQTPGTASPDGKTVTFTQKTVRLVAETGPENDMLSFRIAGHRNPTLVVSEGAVLTVLFVNTDDDMRHNIRFGAVLAVYPNAMTAYAKSSAGTPELAHKSGLLHGTALTLRAPDRAGVYGYCCTVRGHAQGGMAGEIVVRQEAKRAS